MMTSLKDVWVIDLIEREEVSEWKWKQENREVTWSTSINERINWLNWKKQRDNALSLDLR